MSFGEKRSIELIREAIESAEVPSAADMRALRSKIVEDHPFHDKRMLEFIRRPAVPSIQELLAQANASNFYRQLQEQIQEFEARLDPDKDVGLRLVAFGGLPEIRIHLSEVGYADPAMITFRGDTENGDPVQLIQHVSQANVLLIALKRPEPQLPRRKIGFQPVESQAQEE